MRPHTVLLLTLLMAVIPSQLLYAQWETICSARESFFNLNLQQENYLTSQDLLQKFTSDPSVDLIIFGEAHYQPTLPRIYEYLNIIARNPEYNCLFIEATEESWLEEKEIAQGFPLGHPLHFINTFHEQVSSLPMTLHFVDERQRFESWLRKHSSPMTPEELEEMAYEEITYRNLVMGQKIGEKMNSGCVKGVLIVGVGHLSSISRGFPVSPLKDLLLFEGINPRSVYLLDSELFVGVDETLNDSIPSPSLCFDQCQGNPDLPTTEVAFVHQYPEGISRSRLALLDAAQIDPHYGAPTMGFWGDFDATIIFPPMFVRSCQDPRRAK